MVPLKPEVWDQAGKHGLSWSNSGGEAGMGSEDRSTWRWSSEKKALPMGLDGGIVYVHLFARRGRGEVQFIPGEVERRLGFARSAEPPLW